MKKRFLLIIALLSSISIPAAVLDKGGVTFDLQKISQGLFKSAAAAGPADNLITNADGALKEDPRDPLRWQGDYCPIHSRKLSPKDPRRAQLRKIVKWSVKNGVFTVVKPESLNKILPAALVNRASGGWCKMVELPHAKGGLYHISFQYRGKSNAPGRSCLTVEGSTGTAKKWWQGKRNFSKFEELRLTNRFQNYSRDILIPRGIKSLRVVYRIDGVGHLDIRQAAVVQLHPAADRKVTLQLSPMGRLDNTFALAQNLPGIISFIWKRNGTPAETRLSAPQLVMRLPNEVVFHEPGRLKFLGKKPGARSSEYRIDLSPCKARLLQLSDFDNYLRHSALLSTTSAPDSQMVPGKAWVEDKGKKISNTVTFDFKVIPEFKAAKPEIYLPGIYLGGTYSYFSSPANIAAWAKMYDAAGVRWIVGAHRAAYADWRKAGVKVITPELYFIANGYRVGDPKERPETDKFRAIGTHDLKEIQRATCPAAVYEKRPFYVNRTVPMLKKALAGANGLWANWEPYNFAGRGCFCDTCCKNFAKFVKVPLEQMKKEWPRELAQGRKYYKQAVRFRSLEHAKLMNTVNEAVTAATGGKEKSFGFIPGVQVDTMSSSWRQNGFDKETHPIDYAGKFKWMDPWGPYACWRAHSPFVYTKGFNLNTFLKAKEVRAAVNKDYFPSRIKLLAFPHGFQLQDWITQPECIAIELLSFMFNQWEAATLYAFPKGYDARYWKSFADASNIAARYEKYVFKGKRADHRVQLAAQSPFALRTAVTEPLLGTYSYHEMLQHTAFELGNTLIVATFNFWRDGEVFFTCKVKGLSPDTRYTVRNAKTRFTAGNGRAFTGRELARGITLHAGAVRCAVYEIAPEKAADRKLAAFTAADMLKAQRKARPALLKAHKTDVQYEKIYGIKESKLEDISNAGICCKADLKNSTLRISSGKARMDFYAPTACVNYWTVNKKPIIHGSKMSGFGCVAFWNPSTQFKEGFQVTSQKKIPGGIEITAEKLILDRDRSELAGLVMKQRFRITERLRKVEITTKLVNNSDRNISFGVRYNLIPAIPGLPGGFTRIRARGKTVDFKRSFSRSLFTTGTDKEYETAVRKLFGVKSPNRALDAAPVSFIAPGISAGMTVSPGAALAGAAVWDSGRQAAATFEPCFKFMTLGPGGKSFTIHSTMTVKCK